MAYNRPTLQQIRDRITSDVKFYTKIKRILPVSFVGAFANSLAAIVHTIYGFIAWCFKQIFPFSQDGDILLEWGREVVKINREEATFAEHTVQFTGTNAAEIDLTREVKSADGVEFTITEGGFVEEGVVSIKVRAKIAGASGNIDVGETLTLTTSVAGINADGMITVNLSTGADEESIESYRARVLFALANPSSGGSVPDYIREAKNIPGVTRAWVFPEGIGPGSVVVKFVTDNEEDIIPTVDKIAEVLAKLSTWKPATARLEVNTPLTLPLDMTIAITPNSASVQAAIEAEVADLILRTAQVNGAYKNEDEVYDGKILLSKIREAVSIAAGEEDNEIVSMLGEAPANVEPDEFYLVVPGVITWQAI